MSNFTFYIDSLGQLDDEDLYLDIDETMKKRETAKREADEILKSYTSFCKHKGAYEVRKRDHVSKVKRGGKK